MTNLVIVNRYFLPDEGATAQLVGALAFALAERRWRIRIVTSRQLYGIADASLAPNEDVGGLQIHRVWTSRFGRKHLAGRAIDYVTFYLSAFSCLLRVARRGDLVLAMTDPPLLSVLVWIATRVSGAKQINWLQDVFPEVAVELGVIPAGFVSRLLHQLRNRSLRHAAMNVAIGDRMAAHLRRAGGSTTRIAVVHNWANGEAIQPLASRLNSLRTAWELTDRFVVGYSGNFGRAHEFETILQAAEALRNESKIVFLLIGDGHYRTHLESEVRRRGLLNIIIKPFQPTGTLKESLAVPDVHLVSLRPALEGLVVPSKFYGIAAAGRPTIFVGDPSGEVPGILASADCGVSVAVGDAGALASCIKSLHSAPTLCERWGRNARAAFDRYFNREQAIEHWSKILAQVSGAAGANAVVGNQYIDARVGDLR